MKRLARIVLVAVSVTAGCKATPPDDKPIDAASPASEAGGLSEIGTNPQGYAEYRHEPTGMVFVRVPAGTFRMGSQHDDERPIHEVTLRSFLISKYEVTQGQWQKMTGTNPSHFQKGDNYPVEQVSWEDCREFCRKAGLRLPTDAEWEYACRAGTSTEYYWGDNVSDDYLWHNGNSGGSTHPAGQKKPNGFGLYDMSGNVWEWCQDWFGPYGSGPQANPTGPDSGQYRVLRGGCWSSVGSNLYRSAFRGRRGGDRRSNFLGFRCVAPEK